MFAVEEWRRQDVGKAGSRDQGGQRLEVVDELVAPRTDEGGSRRGRRYLAAR